MVDHKLNTDKYHFETNPQHKGGITCTAWQAPAGIRCPGLDTALWGRQMGEEQWLRTTGTIRAGWEDGVCFVLQGENCGSNAPESRWLEVGHQVRSWWCGRGEQDKDWQLNLLQRWFILTLLWHPDRPVVWPSGCLPKGAGPTGLGSVSKNLSPEPGSPLPVPQL